MKEAYQVMIGTDGPWTTYRDEYNSNCEATRYRFRDITHAWTRTEKVILFIIWFGFPLVLLGHEKIHRRSLGWLNTWENLMSEGLLFPKEELNYYNGILRRRPCKGGCLRRCLGRKATVFQCLRYQFGSDITFMMLFQQRRQDCYSTVGCRQDQDSSSSQTTLRGKQWRP